jgi:hypothetical protein
MIENVLTNYNIKFTKSQLDHDLKISKSKLYYNIYNNKISEPLHKFWFSVSNIKYSNNYSDFKTIRFLMNNKNENISRLINYIKDIGDYMVEKLSPTFENISIDYPWKESTQYPYIFTFFTNTNTIFIDSSGNELKYDSINYNDFTYSIIFEIASIRIIPIILDKTETYTMKLNLVLILIKEDEKKDLKKFSFINSTNLTNLTNLTNSTNIYNDSINTNHNISYNKASNQMRLPFINDISGGFTLNKIDRVNTSGINKSQAQTSTTKLMINTEEILKAINGLKKVEIKKELTEDLDDKNEDNNSQINIEYIEKKNSLKKVKTKEKSLLKNLQKKKKNKKKEIENIIDIDNELEREFEKVI